MINIKIIYFCYTYLFPLDIGRLFQGKKYLNNPIMIVKQSTQRNVIRRCRRRELFRLIIGMALVW